MTQKIEIYYVININPLKAVLSLMIVLIASIIAFQTASAGISKAQTGARKYAFLTAMDYEAKKTSDKQVLYVTFDSQKDKEPVVDQQLKMAQVELNAETEDRIESKDDADSKEETGDSIESTPEHRPKPKRARTRLFDEFPDKNTPVKDRIKSEDVTESKEETVDSKEFTSDRPKTTRTHTRTPDDSSEKKDITTLPDQIIKEETIKVKLEVLSRPAKADWYIDGEYMGITKGTKNIGEGTYLITVSKAGYFDWAKRVTVLPGKKAKVVARLKKVKRKKPRKKVPLVGGF